MPNNIPKPEDILGKKNTVPTPDEILGSSKKKNDRYQNQLERWDSVFRISQKR